MAIKDRVVKAALIAAGVSEVSIAFLGDKDLQRQLNRLEKRSATKVVTQALRASAKRTKTRLIQNLSGDPVGVRTGELRRAFQGAKIRAGKRRRGLIRLGIVVPSRDELGISASDPHFYPYAVEYGHGAVQARPYIRPAVDEHYDAEIAAIGRDIGKRITKAARK